MIQHKPMCMENYLCKLPVSDHTAINNTIFIKFYQLQIQSAIQLVRLLLLYFEDAIQGLGPGHVHHQAGPHAYV